jgi:hypothetical protein
MGIEKTRADLLPGTLDMLVLEILMSGHLHGYANRATDPATVRRSPAGEEGSLYPALLRLGAAEARTEWMDHGRVGPVGE